MNNLLFYFMQWFFSQKIVLISSFSTAAIVVLCTGLISFKPKTKGER